MEVEMWTEVTVAEEGYNLWTAYSQSFTKYHT
jgi:hypothetical protein